MPLPFTRTEYLLFGDAEARPDVQADRARGEPGPGGRVFRLPADGGHPRPDPPRRRHGGRGAALRPQRRTRLLHRVSGTHIVTELSGLFLKLFKITHTHKRLRNMSV